MKIEFAQGPNGKQLPLQRVRTVYVPVIGEDGVVAAFEFEDAGPLYVSHFETCPNASEFSRKAKK